MVTRVETLRHEFIEMKFLEPTGIHPRRRRRERSRFSEKLRLSWLRKRRDATTAFLSFDSSAKRSQRKNGWGASKQETWTVGVNASSALPRTDVAKNRVLPFRDIFFRSVYKPAEGRPGAIHCTVVRIQARKGPSHDSTLPCCWRFLRAKNVLENPDHHRRHQCHHPLSTGEYRRRA